MVEKKDFPEHVELYYAIGATYSNAHPLGDGEDKYSEFFCYKDFKLFWAGSDVVQTKAGIYYVKIADIAREEGDKGLVRVLKYGRFDGSMPERTRDSLLPGN